MTDQTFNINVNDNFDQTAARAQNAQRAIDDLNASMQKASDPQAELFRQAYQQGGAEGGLAVAQMTGRSYEDLAKSAGILSPAQDKVAASTDKVTSTMKGARGELGSAGVAYGSLGNLIERQATRIAIGLAIWTTLRTVQQEIQQTIQAMEQYSIAVARFAAITDQSVGDAVNQYRTLRMEAQQAGYTPTQAAPGILEAGRFQKTAGGQQELFGAAAKLSEVLGLQDTTQAVNALGEAQLATGKSASEMADLVYAGYKRVGGDASQFMNILPSINSLADQMGTSFEKSFALITSGAAASGQTMSTVYQAVNRFSENIDTLNGDKLLSFINGFKSMGIEVTNANGSLKNTGEIFAAIGAQWNQLSSEQQAKVIDLLGGDKVKGTARNAGMGIMQALAQGMTDSLGDVQGAVDKAGAIIDNSFGQTIKRVQAIIKGYEAEGEGGKALISKAFAAILPITSGPSGGIESEIVAKSQSMGALPAAQTTKEDLMRRLVGASPDDIKAAAAEYDKAILDIMKAFPISSIGIDQYFITAQDAQTMLSKAGSAGTAAGNALDAAFAQAVGNVGAPIIAALQKAFPGILGAAKTAGTQAGEAVRAATATARTPQSDFAALAQQFIQNKQAGEAAQFSTLQSILPTQPVDLTKMSQAEINQAKQLSLQISLMELDAIREQAIMMGLTATQADALVQARKQELEESVKLLETQRDMHYETGLEVANLEKATQVLKQQQESQKSDFQFRRLKDVNPEQFPQLQALANMYNQFLTNIGSPEKNQNINLLMGQDNVFKTLNVRMTALQLALEDLTKVEKAQLSGTWNLPSGATALVPISSLDLQRWNAPQGGGLSADAIKNLMSAFNTGQQPVVGATNQVQQAVMSGTDRVVAALSKLPEGRFSTNLDEERGRKQDELNKSTSQFTHNIDEMTAQRRDAQNQPRTAGQFTRNIDEITAARNEARQALQALSRIQAPISSTDSNTLQSKINLTPKFDLTVAPLPINATFGANLVVNLDSKQIAESLYPVMYRMFVKFAASIPSMGGSTGTVRQ